MPNLTKESKTQFRETEVEEPSVIISKAGVILKPALCWFQAQHLIRSYWKSRLGPDISGKTDILAPETWRPLWHRSSFDYKVGEAAADATLGSSAMQVTLGKSFHSQSSGASASLAGAILLSPVRCEWVTEAPSTRSLSSEPWVSAESLGSCWVCLSSTVKEKIKPMCGRQTCQSRTHAVGIRGDFNHQVWRKEDHRSLEWIHCLPVDLQDK